MAERLKPFGVAKILYSSLTEKDYASQIPAEYVDLDKLLCNSDFVLGCCALTADNVGLMDSSAFKKMKKTAIFIKTIYTMLRHFGCGARCNDTRTSAHGSSIA